MEDEVASSNESVILDGRNSPSEQGGHILRINIDSPGGGSEEEGTSTRIPFRQLSSASSSGSSSNSRNVSKTSKSGKKKASLQRQKSVGKNIKCVLIGDSKTGKSALVRSFLLGQSNHPDYVPTTQDIHIHTADEQTSQENGENSGNLELKNVTLHICDTGGQQDMDRLRPLCYSQAQMVIICFNVMNPSSFANVTLKWLPEVKRHGIVTEDPENPMKLLLVGTQSDLRSNVNMLLKLMDDGLAPVSEMQALRLANKIGALKYVESSSISRCNVDHIFDLVLTYGQGKVMPKQLSGFDVGTGFQGKILPNITERKLQFWRRWKGRQNKSSKMKRMMKFGLFLTYLCWYSITGANSTPDHDNYLIEEPHPNLEGFAIQRRSFGPELITGLLTAITTAYATNVPYGFNSYSAYQGRPYGHSGYRRYPYYSRYPPPLYAGYYGLSGFGFH
ncbi:unnamed protein product [Orchesella dallaii]|uniref:Rho-related GTP-binding protein RhoU n=1 Tax=Orchesella dallaii TaxID=48710 RepID=A0ABP1QKK0_9HEXA